SAACPRRTSPGSRGAPSTGPRPAGLQPQSKRARGGRHMSSRVGLLSGDLEGAAFLLILPGARDGAAGEVQIFNSAVNDVGQCASRLVLGVCLEMYDPPFGIERRVLDGNIIGARIDDPRDRLAIPVEHDDDVGTMTCVARPGAEPGP